jgi:hypothetical protein
VSVPVAIIYRRQNRSTARQTDDEVIRDLVVARVVALASLVDVDRVLAELGRTCASLSTRKPTLCRAFSGGHRGRIAAACFQNACTIDDVRLVPYDVTTCTSKWTPKTPAIEIIANYPLAARARRGGRDHPQCPRGRKAKAPCQSNSLE